MSSSDKLNLWADCYIGTKPIDAPPCPLGNPGCVLSADGHIQAARYNTQNRPRLIALAKAAMQKLTDAEWAQVVSETSREHRG